jgi:flagellin FlaB
VRSCRPASTIETVGSVIARSDLDGGTRKVANVTVFFKVAVGKRPIDLRVGSLVVTYHDGRTSIQNVYTANATGSVISFTSPGVILKQIVDDGDHLIEFGELCSITVGIEEMADLQPTEVLTIQLKPVVGSALKVERRLPPSFDPVMDLA